MKGNELNYQRNPSYSQTQNHPNVWKSDLFIFKHQANMCYSYELLTFIKVQQGTETKHDL